MVIRIKLSKLTRADEILLCNTSKSNHIEEPCCNWESVFQFSAKEGDTKLLSAFFKHDWNSILHILRNECKQPPTSDVLIILANKKTNSVFILSILESKHGLCMLFDLKFEFGQVNFFQAYESLLSHIGSCTKLDESDFAFTNFEKPMKLKQAKSTIRKLFKQCSESIYRYCVVASNSTSPNLEKTEEIVRNPSIV